MVTYAGQVILLTYSVTFRTFSENKLDWLTFGGFARKWLLNSSGTLYFDVTQSIDDSLTGGGKIPQLATVIHRILPLFLVFNDSIFGFWRHDKAISTPRRLGR